MINLPPPSQLLGIKKFDSWWPGQEQLFSQLSEWLRGDERFMAASVPTGLGKSLIAVLAAHYSQRKWAYLTSTNGLQDQLLQEFSTLGLVDIRGQRNYACIQFDNYQVDTAPCQSGYHCPVKGTCLYYSQVGRARASSAIITNYAYWLAQNQYGQGLKEELGEDIRLLVMDEAHLAGNSLSSFLRVEFDDRDKGEFVTLSRELDSWSYEDWREASGDLLPTILEEKDALERDLQENQPPPHGLSARYHYIKGLVMKLERLSKSEYWVMEKGETTTFDPVWVSPYAPLLFQKVEKVLLLSAILTPKHTDKLGIKPKWLRASSPFPALNTPITHIKTVRIDHRTKDGEMLFWADRIDDIIGGRLDRKGIVFTVSYRRAEFFKNNSRYADILYMHDSRNVAEVVRRFKEAPPPAVLVSPAVTTGWDFPQDDCRYIVVGKVPYPDTRGALIKARKESDKEWPDFIAMETLVQECGRGSRSKEDQCEVLIVDDNWLWWWRRNKDMAPIWFQARYTGSVGLIPKAQE